MTYEEAIEIMSSKICYNLWGCMDGICKHTNEKPCAVQMEREVLEKQTPKKPLPTKAATDMLGADDPLWGEGECPNCEHYIRLPHKYCYKCGQAIDWSEEE